MRNSHDIRGKSRTPENLAYLNKHILHAHQTASNQWQGTLIFNGSQAQATVTRIGNDTLSIKGYRGIFCGGQHNRHTKQNHERDVRPAASSRRAGRSPRAKLNRSRKAARSKP